MSCTYFQVQMSNWTFCYTSHNRILFALWFKTLQTDFVVTIYVLYILSSPDVKLNLLLHKSQQNPVCSLIQNFANWLCGDNLCLVHTFKSRCQIEPFATQVTTESCLFALWPKTMLQTDFVVIIHSFYFQVQMSNWTFCYTSHNRILFALWFKTLQTNNVGIIYVLHILSSSFWNFPPPTQSPSVDLF